MKKNNLIAGLVIAFIAVYGVAFFYCIVCFGAIIGGTFTDNFSMPFIIALIIVCVGSPIVCKLDDEMRKH